jgi:hypothetical protein
LTRCLSRLTSVSQQQHPKSVRLTSIPSLFVILVLAASCSSDPGRAVKMQESSGKMNRNSDAAYRAVCTTQTPGSHVGTWTGPPWAAKERAMQDAIDHNKQNPGHQAKAER